MADTGGDEARISELLWRAIKLRASLLAVAIVVSLIAWSAVLSGDQRALLVDAEYCQKLVAIDNSSPTLGTKLGETAPPKDITSTCLASNARSYLESARAIDAFLRDAVKDSSEAAQKLYKERQSLFSEYDSKRKSSYDFQIHLTTEVSSGEMLVNALTVAEVVPFVILGLAAVIIILGFQERAYRLLLVSLIPRTKDSVVSALAKTQFFTFSAFAARQNSWGVKWPIMSMEGITIGGLGAVLVVALAGLLSAFAENVIHLTDSIFHNYLSGLYGFAFILAFWLIYTRRSYRETLEAGARSAAAKGSRSYFSNFRERFLVLVAMVTLVLPWASTPSGLSLKGYFFILPERPRGGFAGISFFPVSPRIFSELRWQLAIALILVVLCAVETFPLRRAYRTARRRLYALRGALAVLTLFWSLNLLLYMGVLEYEAFRGTSWGIQNMILGALRGDGASLLDVYDPAYGFVVFLADCFALIQFSFRNFFGGLIAQRRNTEENVGGARVAAGT